MAVGAVSGIVGAALLGAPAWVAPGAAFGLAVGTALVIAGRGRASAPPRTVAAALGVCAALAGASSLGAPAGNAAAPRGHARVWGRVEEVRAGFGRSDVALRVRAIEPLGDGAVPPPVGSRIRVRGVAWPEGSDVRTTLTLSAPAGFRNLTPHPRWPTLDPFAADARALAHAPLPTRSLHALIGRARARLRGALLATLDEPACGVARALLLGDLALDEDSAGEVRDAGLSHVLAVSGMHVTLLVGALVRMLRALLLRVERLAARHDVGRIAAAVGVPLALVYAPLAGGAPSAWRAALTAAMLWSLEAAGRRPDPVQVTAAAVLAFAAWSPGEILRPAFLLSIGATIAVLTPEPDAQARPLRALAALSLRAALCTAPIGLWCFEGVPLVGVAANVFVVPVASVLLLPLAAAHAVLALVSEPLAALTAAPLDLATRAFLGACGQCAAVSLGRGLPPLDVVEGVTVTVLCLSLAFLRGPRVRLALFVVGAVALGGAEWRLQARERPRGVVRATFLDIGQGDAALLDMPDGRLVLVDAGGAVGAGVDPGQHVVLPLLRARRRASIDLAILTHPHPDHFGGLSRVLAEVPTRELWDTGQAESEEPDGAVARLLREARARGTRVVGPAALCGRPRRFGDATLAVHWPCPGFDAGLDPNDNSFVIELRFGARRLLFTGDVERRAERSLVRAGRLRHVDVLKVPHHGSRTSSTAPFLAALTPALAVVSAGRTNRFGHPHPDVLERLEGAAGGVYRIDREGSVQVWTDGHALRVQTWTGRSHADDGAP